MLLVTAVGVVAALSAPVSAAILKPFKTLQGNILDGANRNFTFVGVNWPGAGEAMIPEGLQMQSVEYHVGEIKKLGFNAIRLTFPIELIDDIYANDGQDLPIVNSLVRALGADNATAIFNQIQLSNPWVTRNTTRLQAYDKIFEEAAKQSIAISLDNHVSKAKWCCGNADGNAWFGDTYFNVEQWIRGLEYMATYFAERSNFVSIGLRNELREPTSSTAGVLPYTWPVWYDNMVAAANAVNRANPDLLILLSGLNYDTTLAPIPNAEDLGDGRSFRLSDFAYEDKLVLELHNYQTGTTDCAALEGALYNGGFRAIEGGSVNQMPVLLTEFGFDQTTGASSSVYAQCIADYIPSIKAGWFVWTYGGGYYIREGIQDREDTWGLMTRYWSILRNETAFDEAVGRMVTESSSGNPPPAISRLP